MPPPPTTTIAASGAQTRDAPPSRRTGERFGARGLVFLSGAQYVLFPSGRWRSLMQGRRVHVRPSVYPAQGRRSLKGAICDIYPWHTALATAPCSSTAPRCRYAVAKSPRKLRGSRQGESVESGRVSPGTRQCSHNRSFSYPSPRCGI
jgi:hypothetical protein